MSSMTTETKPRYTVRGAKLGDSAEIARLAGELGYPAAPAEISTRLQLLLGIAATCFPILRGFYTRSFPHCWLLRLSACGPDLYFGCSH